MLTSVRNRLEDLVRISESTMWSRYPEAASQKMVDTLAKVFHCELVFIHLMDVTGDSLVKHVYHGVIPAHLSRDPRVSITTGRMLQMMKTHQPIIMDFLNPDPADSIPADTFFRSAISVPLLADDDMLGMYSLVYSNYQEWTAEDIEFLLLIGRLVGISIHQAQIAQKATDLDILLERKRLCGEIHDNLSQLISSLNLGAEAALLSLAEGNSNQLKGDLERIRYSSQEADRTLREEMLSLRTPTNETEGLVPAIREYLKRFNQQWRIDTDLQVKEGLEPLFVSTHMELQFMRILHEAFSNVLRHATASKVSVQLDGNQNRLIFQIHDNGRGFDPETVSSKRLGLRIMRERAESLGGELTIGSGDNVGTTIRVEVPRSI
ncbi:MAG: GAF domain-containing sensor histidine kinase [Anaerolineales bacterium]|nr:GAF domain-containing sensor histidine kinase [Anaerolineales bacterium]